MLSKAYLIHCLINSHILTNMLLVLNNKFLVQHKTIEQLFFQVFNRQKNYSQELDLTIPLYNHILALIFI